MSTPGFQIRTLIEDGGFIMWPLLVCSVLATIVVVERAIALFSAKRHGRWLAHKVIPLARSGQVEKARDACERTPPVALAQVFDAGLVRAGDPGLAAAAVERLRGAAGHELRRGLWILGTIGAAAPFVGLFGTVIGIVKSFQDIARHGQGGFGTVAAGISEALIATGAGIAVAVVAFGFHNYFQVKVASILADWKLRSDELLEAIELGTRRTEGALG